MKFNLFSQKKRIDFIVIGVQKAGTSALDYYLRQHPEIKMAKIKEVHYFDNDSFFENAKGDYSYYHKFFGNLKNRFLYGEATPIYIYWKNAIERIKKYNKNIKLIILLRDPVERAYSHWNMELKKGNEKKDFSECIKADLKSNSQDRVTSYIDRGKYSSQIIRLLKLFDRSQLHFIKYEDFNNKQSEEITKVFKFLNLRTDLEIEKKTVYKFDYSSILLEKDEVFLRKYFLEEVKMVEKILDWDCSDWKEKSFK